MTGQRAATPSRKKLEEILRAGEIAEKRAVELNWKFSVAAAARVNYPVA